MEQSVSDAHVGHIPYYIAVPGQTDWLFVVVAVFVVVLVLILGVIYFQLHALPEQLAHKGERTHMQLVAILALLALFTHNNLFWVAALLLAAIEFPSYERYFSSISQSLHRIAERNGAPAGEGDSVPPPGPGDADPDSMAKEG